MKSVAILQSSYIPWKGYFDIIHDVDLFVFYDDRQYTRADWRNRNSVKTPNGPKWLTVPVGSKIHRLICEVEIEDSAWQAKHWMTLRHLYGHCPYFSAYRAFLEEIYRGRSWENLSDLNQHLIRSIATEFLGIETEFHDSRAYNVSGDGSERLAQLAQAYIDTNGFGSAGIELVWKDYSGYPEYPQRFPPFEHHVTILDLLFNVGPDAPWYIWGWRSYPPSLAAMGASSEVGR